MKKLLFIVCICTSINLKAQELNTANENISISELPEYVIISSEDTKLLGGINIMIDYKNSIYKDQLVALANMLQNGKKLKVRNQTDLLNAMSQLGFDYKDAYIGQGITYDSKSIDRSKNSVNMVFRKKQQYRDN